MVGGGYFGRAKKRAARVSFSVEIKRSILESISPHIFVRDLPTRRSVYSQRPLDFRDARPDTPLRAAAMSYAPPLGHTAEVRAQKMRALRAEAGRKAKADLEAARERCARAASRPPSETAPAHPHDTLPFLPPTGCARRRRFCTA